MVFMPCKIVEWGNEEASSDYPVTRASGEPPFLEGELGDGDTRVIQVGDLNIYAGSEKVFSTENPSTVMISESRIAFACPNYAKGSTWLGIGGLGAAVAVSAMAVSAARAKRRAAGKCFVGQIRYPWVASVGWRNPRHKFLLPQNFLVTMMSSGRPVSLSFTVGWGAQPEPMAADILARIVANRLTSEPEMPPALRQQFVRTPVAPQTSLEEEFTGWTLPHSFAR